MHAAEHHIAAQMPRLGTYLVFLNAVAPSRIEKVLVPQMQEF